MATHRSVTGGTDLQNLLSHFAAEVEGRRVKFALLVQACDLEEL